MSWFEFRPYVSVAQRRAKAAREVAQRRKKGEEVTPIEIVGRKIATTFWGTSWSENLESYSDFSNRLPRGRTYVRNGSVVNLQIHSGRIVALVSGSELYTIEIKIDKLDATDWESVKNRCAGQVGSVIELLQGKLSKHVMDVVTSRPGGLFPKPSEIKLKCSCPDWATMCKHVAAALYGVGARLDQQPELLFKLRQVDHFDLIQSAGDLSQLPKESGAPTLADDDLAEVFGIELAGSEVAEVAAPTAKPRKKAVAARKTVAAAIRSAKAKNPAAAKARATTKANKTPKKSR